ncbi:trehalose-6-phosphate synthase [Pantoea vagans]|uniref:trehalose-6-phosphate synthase n=1 Tax=Pantoea vagans TaxID=470934 RepID=UPI000B033467|nr:trehalose-6-phosphate synthase [Pantoea vagans]
MSGLILVSHNQSQRSTLTAVYDGILSLLGGLWISWNGESTVISQDASRPCDVQQHDQYETVTFTYTPGELNEGYHNYIHKGLCPVFHQRPDMARFCTNGFQEYKKINKAYARAICENATPDGVIWIQDYHLLGCAVHRALQMPLHERRCLHARLMKGLHMHNSHYWAASFLRQLTRKHCRRLRLFHD